MNLNSPLPRFVAVLGWILLIASFVIILPLGSAAVLLGISEFVQVPIAEVLVGACVWLVLALTSAWVGHFIGRFRGRARVGGWLGFWLGPIGWLIAALLPPEGRKCPECLGVIPDAARRCKHCGSSLIEPVPGRVPDPTPEEVAGYFVLRQDETEGPFSEHQLRSMFVDGRLTGSALCARPGDQDWKPIASVL